jgi:hypothetical protein
MNSLIKISLSLVAILTIASPVLAQGAPPATPIDGGLSLLLAGVAAYGIKKIRDSRK